MWRKDVETVREQPNGEYKSGGKNWLLLLFVAILILAFVSNTNTEGKWS